MASNCPLCVLKTDNAPGVRDGYIGESTPGHARAVTTRAEGPFCGRNVIASARACTPLPPQNFHGKEGVDGSSPSEGFAKAPQMGPFRLGKIALWLSVLGHGKRRGKTGLGDCARSVARRACNRSSSYGRRSLTNGPAALERPGPGTGKELRCKESVCKASRRSLSWALVAAARLHVSCE
jgi:hypothetical protein